MLYSEYKYGSYGPNGVGLVDSTSVFSAIDDGLQSTNQDRRVCASANVVGCVGVARHSAHMLDDIAVSVNQKSSTDVSDTSDMTVSLSSDSDGSKPVGLFKVRATRIVVINFTYSAKPDAYVVFLR